jgi:DNA-binding response OmpR family regulator
MTQSPHILIVEDDLATQALLSAFLGEAGYTVTSAATGEAMRTALGKTPVDLILMDLNLPDADGTHLANFVRRQSKVPIIMVSARSETRDRITGLELGADDYVTKPFHPRELVARVRNVLGRTEQKRRNNGDGVIFRFGGWTVDLLWRRLTNPDGQLIPMTATEFDLLAVLVARAGQPLTRDQLLEATGAPGRNVNDRSVDTLISRVRRKIGDTRGGPRMIETCHGQGYRFAVQVG